MGISGVRKTIGPPPRKRVNANGRRKIAPKIERETFSRINTRRPSVSICVRDRRVRFYPSLGDSRRWRWWRSNGFWRESNANVGGLDISDATFGAFGTWPIILTLAAPQQVVWTDVFSRTVRKRFNRFVRKRLCTHTHTHTTRLGCTCVGPPRTYTHHVRSTIRRHASFFQFTRCSVVVSHASARRIS